MKHKYIGCTYKNKLVDVGIFTPCISCMFIPSGKTCKLFRKQQKAVLEYPLAVKTNGVVVIK